jgi:dihydropteroate synthase
MTRDQQSDKSTLFSGTGSMEFSGKFPDISTPRVMGILNISPDSFYDGGRYSSETQWAKQVEKMISEGASIIDIGALSTRPGAREIPEEEEIHRIIPVIKSLRKKYPEIFISVDTYRSSVAEVAISSGADMINDISGGTFDNAMARLIGKHNIPYVMMHIQGRPGNMQTDPQYDDVVEDIASFFRKQISIFNEHGATQIILDPGFGFGKNVAHNYTILHSLKRFGAFGYPIMVGVSRKSMINSILGTKPENALNGTTVLNTIALLNGAKVLRVHDVREAMEAIKLTEMMKMGD